MKKTVILIPIIIMAAGLFGAGYFSWQNLRGAGPAGKPPPREITKLMSGTARSYTPSPPPLTDHSGPLKLPPEFASSSFAKNLGNPRVLCLDPEGTLLVSLSRQGKVVALPDKEGSGVAAEPVTVLEGLDKLG